MVKFLPYFFGILALIFGVFFLIYGIKGGFINKKILSYYPDTYVTGKQALIRGVFYIAIGLFFLFGCFMIVLILMKNW